MEYSIRKENNINIVSLKGSLLAEVQTKGGLVTISELIENGSVNFVMEMDELKFINSSGLGMLLTSLTKARKAGGDVVLSNINEQIKNLLVVTKLTAIFTTVNGVEEGVSALTSA